MEEKKTMNAKIRLLLDVLLFGSIWGILEATLGTLLHLSIFDGAGMYLASTTVMLPIAYTLMAMCYKRTGKLYSVVMMGLIAGLIKLSVAFVIGFIDRVYSPAIYIVVESLAMFGGLAVFRPKNVLSLKTFGAIVLANTTYQLSYLVLSSFVLSSRNAFANATIWAEVGEKYLFKVNCVALLYTLAIGGIAFGILKLVEHYHLELRFDYKKVIYSPITASIMFMLAVGITVTFAALF